MRNKIFYNIYLQVFLPFYLFTFLPLSVSAQRIGCVHTGDRPSTRGDNQVLPMPYDFDPQKTFRSPENLPHACGPHRLQRCGLHHV